MIKGANKMTHLKFSFTLVIFMLLTSCAGGIDTLLTGRDAAYISGYPENNAAGPLGRISDTVKKVSSTAYYTGYVFPDDLQVSMGDINQDFVERYAEEVIFFNNSVAGTATIIMKQNNKIAMLTCAHVVSFPDTLVRYVPDQSGRGSTQNVKSVAFLTRQSNYVVGLPEGGDIDIIQTDSERDLAILGKEFEEEEVVLDMPVFDFPFGIAEELRWGNMVYLAGFPRGYHMITRGVVSDPNRNLQGSFLLDAPFNQGMSGGLALAIRGNSPNFELMGLTNSAAADFQYNLVPDVQATSEGFIPNIPYNDQIFIELKRNISYGVTFVIPINEIIAFIEEYNPEMQKQGYEFNFMLRRALRNR